MRSLGCVRTSIDAGKRYLEGGIKGRVGVEERPGSCPVYVSEREVVQGLLVACSMASCNLEPSFDRSIRTPQALRIMWS